MMSGKQTQLRRAGSIWKNVLAGLVTVYILHTAYLTGSAVWVVGIVLLTTICAIAYDIFALGKAQITLVVFLVLMLYAPPSVIFDSPITIAGANLIPVYLLMLGLPVYFFLIKKVVASEGAHILKIAVPLIIAALLQFPLMAFYDWPGDIMGLSSRVTLLLGVLAILVPLSAVAVFSGFTSASAYSVISIIIGLQIYQAWVFLFNNNVDPYLWFGETRWLRFGLGYTGDAFNPARMYAFFWDPNYLISILTPLYLKAISDDLTRMQRVVAGVTYLFSVLMTLSYQSVLIAVIVLICVRMSIQGVVLLRRLAIVGAYLLPIAVIVFGIAVSGSSLPPPEDSSLFERIHIVWAVAQALIYYPMGIGAGTFETLGLQYFFDDAMIRSLPPHGWLYELMVIFGIIGYYTLLFLFSSIVKGYSKEGNIAFLSLIVWGVTSPALTTPYFWVAFGMTIVLAKHSAKSVSAYPASFVSTSTPFNGNKLKVETH